MKEDIAAGCGFRCLVLGLKALQFIGHNPVRAAAKKVSATMMGLQQTEKVFSNPVRVSATWREPQQCEGSFRNLVVVSVT